MDARIRGVRPLLRIVPIALCVVALAPAAPRAAERWRVVARFVDARHPELASVPSVEIAGERRPVLGRPASVRLAVHTVRPPGTRHVRFDVPVPEALRGRPLRLFASLPAPGVALVDQTPRAVAQPDDHVAMDVTLSREAVDKPPTIVVTGRAASAETRWVSEPVAVPPGARLRFGIGIDESEWSPALPATTFVASAIAEGGGETTLARRRLDPGRHPNQRRWLDQDIDLGPFAGRNVRFAFATEAHPHDAGAPFVFPVWGDPTVRAPDATSPPPRNVLLVSIDTLRADHLGCYGYSRPTSPTIDAVLAARGTLFEHVFASSPWTFPSHAGMLTGRYPCVHRFYPAVRSANDENALGALPADAPTLAEVLRARGYATGGFTEDGWISAEMGFARGFGTFVENRAFPRFSEPLGQVERTLHDALAWIRRNDDGPWFVFVHTYQVHNPYTPPPGYLAQVAADAGDDRASADAAAYDAEIRYTDDVLAHFLAGLDAAGAGDALVVLTSDHGEQFGEHGLWMHGNSLYDELLHVPLIVRAPGLVPAGKRIATDVGLLDVVPTILDLAGAGAPPHGDGRSLARMIREGDGTAVPLLADLGDTVAARNDGLKWIIDEKTGATQVFALATDPHELRDVAGTRQLPAEGAKWLADFRALCPPATPGATVPGTGNIDPAVRDKLRALGYIE